MNWKVTSIPWIIKLSLCFGELKDTEEGFQAFFEALLYGLVVGGGSGYGQRWVKVGNRKIRFEVQLCDRSCVSGFSALDGSIRVVVYLNHDRKHIFTSRMKRFSRNK